MLWWFGSEKMPGPPDQYKGWVRAAANRVGLDQGKFAIYSRPVALPALTPTHPLSSSLEASADCLPFFPVGFNVFEWVNVKLLKKGVNAIDFFFKKRLIFRLHERPDNSLEQFFLIIFYAEEKSIVNYSHLLIRRPLNSKIFFSKMPRFWFY